MNHPTSLLRTPLNPDADPYMGVSDPNYLADCHNATLVESIEKAMAFVFIDQRPFEMVGSRFELYLCLNHIFTRLEKEQPYGERIYVSVAYLIPGVEAFTLYMPACLWFATCETEEKMEAYFNICGYFNDGDDGND